MFDQLNDDCQLHIIKYLNLKNQIVLWKATKKFSDRMNSNICRHWQCNMKYHLDWSFFNEVKDDPEFIDEILSIICETLQSLNLTSRDFSQLKLLKKYNFPNIRMLVIYREREERIHELNSMAEIFPTISSLKLMDFNLDNFKVEKFKQLRKLFLWDCEKIYNAFGSESLEELISAMPSGDDFFYSKGLMCLPTLRTLAFECDEFSMPFIRSIIKERSSDITELSFYYCLRHYIDPMILQWPKRLTRVTFDENTLSMEKLYTLVAGWPLLERIDLLCNDTFSSEIQLWKIVNACPRLKIFYINIWYGALNNFFKPSRHYMDDALKNRSELLTLHFRCTYDETRLHLVSITKANAEVLNLLKIEMISSRSRKTSVTLI